MKGYKPNFVIRPGRNDGSMFSKYCKAKSLCFGTGEKGQRHKVNEYVSIHGFIDASEIILEVVKEICYL